MYNFGPGYPVGVSAVVPQADQPSGGIAEIPVAQAAGYTSVSVSLAGAPATGDTVSFTIENHTVTYTLISTDTLATAATALAADINADTTDKALVVAAASGNGYSVKSLAQGPAALYPVSASATGITATASAARMDFANQIVIPNQTFAYTTENGPVTFYSGQPVSVSAETKTQLAAQGLIL